jgi:hypothetical protein
MVEAGREAGRAAERDGGAEREGAARRPRCSVEKDNVCVRERIVQRESAMRKRFDPTE